MGESYEEKFERMRTMAKEIPPVPAWLLRDLERFWWEFNLTRIHRAVFPEQHTCNKLIQESFGWEAGGLPGGEGKLPVVELGGTFVVSLCETYEEPGD